MPGSETSSGLDAGSGEARRVLVLQGGGALGSYQAGVYEGLAEEGLRPNWIAGISIGAINAAIIAGNPPERRVDRLRAFWETVSANPLWGAVADYAGRLAADLATRRVVNQVSAATAVVAGAPGFFMPRPLSPALSAPGSPAATSWYDTTPLRHTLEKLIDFDRLNAGETRLSVGAVNIK